MAYRITPEEDIERAFDINGNSPIKPRTEQPGIAHVERRRLMRKLRLQLEETIEEDKRKGRGENEKEC